MTQIYDRIVKTWPACLALVMAVMVLGVTDVTAECIPVERWHEATVKGSPGLNVAPLEQMNAVLLAFITNRYNATPPTSDVRPDVGYMLMGRLKATGMPLGDIAFGLFKGGCLAVTFIMPMPHSKQAPGEPI